VDFHGQQLSFCQPVAKCMVRQPATTGVLR
jgi:hypothetical protein